MATPNQRIQLTSSCNTNADMLTATGNSTELKMELKVSPAFGIPDEKQSGGITVPNMARIIPHFNKLPAKAPLIKKVGGRIAKINKQAPVIINALFFNGGYSLPNLPFNIKNAA